MGAEQSDQRRFTQHRFLGRLSLDSGPPPSQYILYNYVSDYYFYDALNVGVGFLPMRATLLRYLAEQGFAIVAIFNSTEGVIYGDGEMEARARELLAVPAPDNSFLGDLNTEPAPTPQTAQAGRGTARNLVGDLGVLMRQPGVPYDKVVRTAVIIERVQNFVSTNGIDPLILDQIQSWSSLHNGNISVLVADVPLLSELPSTLAGPQRSGVERIPVGLPAYDEINQLLIYAERGLLGRAFGQLGRASLPRIAVDLDQRRDLIGRLDGVDISTIRGYLNQALRLGLDTLTLRTLRTITSRTADIWPDLLAEGKLRTLEDQLHARVRGQEFALGEVFAKLRAVRDDLQRQRDTGQLSEGLLAYFFFAGPTGVGKTEVFRVLSERLPEVRTRKFNMPEYREEHSTARFFGAPPGYVGHGPGELGEFLLANPVSLVLFDEFEKAHPNVWRNFLTMLEGSLTTGDGIRVDMSQTIFIFTSNAGASELQPIEPWMSPDQQLATRDQNRETVRRALRQAGAPPELIGRLLSSIVPFNHMTESSIEAISRMRLGELVERYPGIARFDQSVVDFLFDEYVRQGRLGARMVVQYINTTLRAELSALKEPRTVVFKNRGGRTRAAADDNLPEPTYQKREQQSRKAGAGPVLVETHDDPSRLSALRPAVVAIMSFDERNSFRGYCNGFFISEQGQIATSLQALGGQMRLFGVYGTDQARVELTLVNYNRFYDLAILRPARPLDNAVPYLLPGNSGGVDRGDELNVYAYSQLAYDWTTERATATWPQTGVRVQVGPVQEQDGRFRLAGELRASMAGAPVVGDDGALLAMVLPSRSEGGNGFALMGSILYACLREAKLLPAMTSID